MGDFKNLLIEAEVIDLHRTTDNGRVKFLCFTRFHDNAMILGVSDGVDVWRLELDSDELDTHRDLAGVTIDAYLVKFRNGLTSGDLSVARIGNKITLTVGHEQDALMFDLFEATAAERRTELQSVLFRLADLASSLETKLAAANKTIDTLKSQNAKAGGLHHLMDLGPKKGAVKNKPKKVGMSVLNPTSKKRKAAQGVVFD
ncbi:uncharacterized protein LOC121372094 [Gigantopelta aegis]|uniref:uncharacterized protein LOC121372094 n=1 Tax=Gigantopelta aegis TaxID=1735272 RepID=UPI001B88A521|nr:uncharacterized protein LOC121372094 [Gigantopelta aegis]